MTPEAFAKLVEAAAANRHKVKVVAVTGFSVVARIASRSGKMAYEWRFNFDPKSGDCEYFGPFSDANEPRFFIDDIRQMMRRE